MGRPSGKCNGLFFSFTNRNDVEIVKESTRKTIISKTSFSISGKKMRWNFSNLAESVNEDHQSHHNEVV